MGPRVEVHTNSTDGRKMMTSKTASPQPESALRLAFDKLRCSIKLYISTNIFVQLWACTVAKKPA